MPQIGVHPVVRPVPVRPRRLATPTRDPPPGARALAPDWPAPRGRRLALGAATAADLAAVRAHVRDGCGAAAPADGWDGLVLAADEVCANVLAHAYGRRPGPLTVDVAADAGGCRVHVTDAGARFDPTTAPEANRAAPTGPAEARPAGGLGWLLVRRSVDRVRYERVGRYNVVTLEVGPEAARRPGPAAPAPDA